MDNQRRSRIKRVMKELRLQQSALQQLMADEFDSPKQSLVDVNLLGKSAQRLSAVIKDLEGGFYE
jgi:hypothetical protein